MSERVALAYSGGLDTTVAVAWLKENKGLDVIAVAVDVGQGGDFEELKDRALKAGASEAVVVAASEQFADHYAAPALQANALYQQKYPLVSALSRPLISVHLAAAAKKYRARFVAHGCTGKGNDQVRFETCLAALYPEANILAPVREWGLTREQAVDYAVERGLPVPAGRSSPYSIDENLWGRAIECGDLEDPMSEPAADVWELTADPQAGDPEYLEIEFRRGMPVSLNGESMPFAALVQRVGKVAGARGFGRIDMIEDRVVGIKSREVYEAPGALALIAAHRDLEELTLDRELLRTKRQLEQRWADLVYEGHWFSPLKESIDAFIAATAPHVSGTVRLKAEPGSIRVVGRSSEESLYDEGLASYSASDTFDHRAAGGFLKLWSLPAKIWGGRHPPDPKA